MASLKAAEPASRRSTSDYPPGFGLALRSSIDRIRTDWIAGEQRSALLGDYVHRCSEHHDTTPSDSPTSQKEGRRAGPPKDEKAKLVAAILQGPGPERDGSCAWTRADLFREREAHFGKRNS
jgi:hypothetical protein